LALGMIPKSKGHAGVPAGPSNVGSVADWSIAADSKSGGAGPQKSSPVGSNPAVSAPFARKLMVGAALPSSPSNLQTSLFGKKRG
jgi:hypothetical protein